MIIQILGTSFLAQRVVQSFKQSDLSSIVDLHLVTRRFENPIGDQFSLEMFQNYFPVQIISDPKDQKEVSLIIESVKPDLFFCLGWNHLLDINSLSAVKLASLGYHPTLLPKHRGRHPIVWALVLGLEKTGSTFFHLSSSADSGAIVAQEQIPIEALDDALSLYSKLILAASRQLERIVRHALDGKDLGATPQREADATYWRKRNRTDGIIDPRMDGKSVDSLVRALGWPYPGADLVTPSGVVGKVVASKINVQPRDRSVEPGSILAWDNSWFLLKCGGESSVWLKVEDVRLRSSLENDEYVANSWLTAPIGVGASKVPSTS